MADGGGGLDKQKLVNDFMTLLTAMEQAVTTGQPGQDPSYDQGRSQAAAAFRGGGRGQSPEEQLANSQIDSFTNYEELALADGRILRRYDTGSVRVENQKSGVIQEERADGSLIISLPNGKVIFQEFRGEPLLVYDTDRGGAPGLARVSSATLPGETAPKFVFHFQDFEGAHLVELETLRYYRVKRPQAPGAGGA